MLYRTFILCFLPFSLFAADFTECQKVLTKSFKIVDGRHALYTAQGWLLFSQTPVKSDKIKKQSIPLGLYLIEDHKAQKEIKIYDRFPKEIALITPYSIRPNEIVKESVGIDTLAILKKSIDAPFPIMGACCTLRGFNSNNGVVTADYINVFMKTMNPVLASASVRFKQTKKGIEVVHKNPFVSFNPFRLGDIILQHNQKIENLATLEKKILFSKVGAVDNFLVARNGKHEHLKVRLMSRLGGGVVADTFLEHLGLLFNEQLEVVGVESKSIMDELKILPSDKLIGVEDALIQSDTQLREYLSRLKLPKETLRFLFERRGLQFFIYVPTASVHKSQ